MSSSTRPSRVVFQLPNIGSWFENIAVTEGGTLLVSRVDVPEVWEVDPATGKAESIISFPAPLTSVTGIAELKPGFFAIGAGQYDMGGKGALRGSMEVWTVDLSSHSFGSKATPKKMVAMEPLGLLNGMAAWDATRVVVVDSDPGRLYIVDVSKGTFDLVSDDELLGLPENPFLPIAANGLKISPDRKHLYFTNSTKFLVGRLPIDADAKPTGKAEVLATGFSPDDLAFSPDGESVFVTTHTANSVVQISVSGEGSERDIVTVAGNKDTLEIPSSTACAFGRGESDKGTLYVVTAGGLSAPVNGQMEPAKVVAVEIA